MKKFEYSLVTVIMFTILWLAYSHRSDIFSKQMPKEVLFGIPNKRTGLSSEECKPYCSALHYHSKILTKEELQSLKEWTLTNPYKALTSDPYKDSLPAREQGVCAVVIDHLSEKKYHLVNFPDVNAAKAAGAILTHHDVCGLCSTLQDLAVYAGNLDIGHSVKLCTIENVGRPIEALTECIERLGFSHPCAQIWAYDARQTGDNFMLNCMLDYHYNEPDGSLSKCLQEDEDISGPMFKAIAGRTRRNTGIANSICRPCSEVQPVEHIYPQ